MRRRRSCQERPILDRGLCLGRDVVGDATPALVVPVAVVVPRPLKCLWVARAAPVGAAAARAVAGVVVALVADAGLAEHVDAHRGTGLGGLPGYLHGPADEAADLAADLADRGGLPPVGGLGLSAVLRGRA